MFVPLLFGIHSLYEWSHDDVVATDPLLQHKAPFLNVPFFVIRAIAYFAVWILTSRLMLSIGKQVEAVGDRSIRNRQQVLSGPLLAVYVLTMSFASLDWAMSLEPHWFSTMYGVHFVVGQALSALCLSILLVTWLVRRGPYAALITDKQLHDLGKLLLAFVMLWAYISFSQFLIIWSGNLPEETPWYLHRLAHGWQSIALMLVLFHFAMPFALLLSSRNKRRIGLMSVLTAGILLMRVADYAWLLIPAWHPEGIHLSWMDPVAFAAVGGLWTSFFLRRLGSLPLPVLRHAATAHGEKLDEVTAS